MVSDDRAPEVLRPSVLRRGKINRRNRRRQRAATRSDRRYESPHNETHADQHQKQSLLGVAQTRETTGDTAGIVCVAIDAFSATDLGRGRSSHRTLTAHIVATAAPSRTFTVIAAARKRAIFLRIDISSDSRSVVEKRAATRWFAMRGANATMPKPAHSKMISITLFTASPSYERLASANRRPGDGQDSSGAVAAWCARTTLLDRGKTNC